MKCIESTGKTVKDAIAKGLAELGCDSGDVDIQVLEMGSPGLFGIFGRPAKVKLTRKQSGRELDIEMPVLSLDQPSGKKREKSRAEKPKAEKAERKPEAPREERAEKAEPQKPRAEKKKREPKPQKPAAEPVAAEETPAPAPIEREPFVPTPDDQLSETAHNAARVPAGPDRAHGRAGADRRRGERGA